MTLKENFIPDLLVINQTAGNMVWDTVIALSNMDKKCALLVGDKDTSAIDNITNIRIHRSIAFFRRSIIHRVISWSIFCIHALIWVFKYPRTVPILFYSNPPFLPWLGLILYCIRGQRYAVLIWDIYPDVIVNMKYASHNNPIIKLWRKINCLAFSRSNVIITIGRNMAKVIAQYLPIDQSRTKIKIVNLWVDTDFIHPLNKEENPFIVKHGLEGKIVIMYSGNMGLGHDIETMLKVAYRMSDVNKVRFVFIGAGPKWDLIQRALSNQNFGNITLLTWLPENEIPYSFSSADIFLVSLETGMEKLAIPSKTISALSAGAYIVALVGTGTELETWFNRSKIGEIVAPGDDIALEFTLRNILKGKQHLDTLKKNAREFAEKNFTKTRGVSLMCHIIRENLI